MDRWNYATWNPLRQSCGAVGSPKLLLICIWHSLLFPHTSKRLEKELGVTLLNRSRTVTLSAAGEQFLPYARLALANLEEGKRLMQSFHSVSAGHVRVAVTPLTGILMLLVCWVDFVHGTHR